ncbi:GntR family transcriptional regulator [Paracoccus methylarcula]|uniref:GntR family transcriptional regulator n=1 Tax=Paracoccus methylarcula TaxID=72022 RepID=A0A422R1B8_9RHOB|nr:GntR family transcriptional regulator [Paracoccus methylarcula]RNF36014.1 GntR family transcriptional regulator [Paracoccus methylarcula]
MATERRKKSDHVAQTLAMEIVRGRFAPGEKLRQDRISQEFGTSHVPVREALLQLVAQGLAISLPRRGICVAPMDQTAIHELKVMRQALEPTALLHSVPNLTGEQIEAADEARLRCDAAQAVFEWEEANRSFHNLVIAGCGMPRLIEEIGKLQLLYARHFLAHHTARWRQRDDTDHQAIMSAIRARDARRASVVLQRHLSRLT